MRGIPANQPPLVLRLAARSIPEPNSGCQLWIGKIDRDGYGRYVVLKKLWMAHRLAYIAANGEIPAGMQIDHLCRVRACINPEHLEPVTNRENALRGMCPGVVIRRSGRCGRGHEMNSENRSVSPKGRQQCRACWRIRSAAFLARKRAAP